MTENPKSEDNPGSARSAKLPLWIWLLPFGFLGLILFASPNFKWDPDTLRTAPFGGDFLQEWVGGRIAGSNDHLRLYDPKFTRQVQHDKSIVGFEWPQSDYFPMVYPPFYYQGMSVFAKLDFRTATILWAILSTFAFTLSVFLLHRFYLSTHSKAGVSGMVLWMIAACCFVPWFKCVTMGQKSSLLLLILTGTFLLQHYKKPFFAGLVFGLLVIKPQLGLVIGFVMILKKQNEFVLGAALMVGTLIGLSWMVEPQLWLDYVKVILGMGDYVQSGGYQLSEAHNFWGATQLSAGEILGAVEVKVVAGILSTVLFGFVLWALRGQIFPSQFRYPIFFSILVFTTVLFSPHFYTYDLTILLLPFALVLSSTGLRGESKSANWCMLLTVLTYGLGGLFAKIAGIAQFQISVVLMSLLIVALAIYARTLSVEEEPAGEAAG